MPTKVDEYVSTENHVNNSPNSSSSGFDSKSTTNSAISLFSALSSSALTSQPRSYISSSENNDISSHSTQGDTASTHDEPPEQTDDENMMKPRFETENLIRRRRFLLRQIAEEYTKAIQLMNDERIITEIEPEGYADLYDEYELAAHEYETMMIYEARKDKELKRSRSESNTVLDIKRTWSAFSPKLLKRLFNGSLQNLRTVVEDKISPAPEYNRLNSTHCVSTESDDDIPSQICASQTLPTQTNQEIRTWLSEWISWNSVSGSLLSLETRMELHSKPPLSGCSTTKSDRIFIHSTKKSPLSDKRISEEKQDMVTTSCAAHLCRGIDKLTANKKDPKFKQNILASTVAMNRISCERHEINDSIEHLTSTSSPNFVESFSGQISDSLSSSKSISKFTILSSPCDVANRTSSSFNQRSIITCKSDRTFLLNQEAKQYSSSDLRNITGIAHMKTVNDALTCANQGLTQWRSSTAYNGLSKWEQLKLQIAPLKSFGRPDYLRACRIGPPTSSFQDHQMQAISFNETCKQLSDESKSIENSAKSHGNCAAIPTKLTQKPMEWQFRPVCNNPFHELPNQQDNMFCRTFTLADRLNMFLR